MIPLSKCWSTGYHSDDELANLYLLLWLLQCECLWLYTTAVHVVCVKNWDSTVFTLAYPLSTNILVSLYCTCPYTPQGLQSKNLCLQNEVACFISDSILLVPWGYCSHHNGKGGNCIEEQVWSIQSLLYELVEWKLFYANTGTNFTLFSISAVKSQSCSTLVIM